MPRVLIAGCGYVGLPTARLLSAAGWDVTGLTHSPESARLLEKEAFPVVCGDLADEASLRALRLPALDAVVHCASSGRGGVEQYQRVYVDGVRNLLAVFPGTCLVFTSSTSVYAQTDGSVVTEESPAEPGRETGQLLRAAEDLALAAGGVAARLAGIYGPARSVLLKKFFSGEATIEGDGSRYVNQIHRDDAAAALALLVTTRATGIFNVADNTSLAQREVYGWLAEHFQRPLPPNGPVDPNRKRGVTHKQVSNARLRALGWTPRYPSFRDAVMHDPELLVGFD